MPDRLSPGVINREIARQLERAKADPDTSAIDLRDSESRGLVARVTKTGLVTFYLDYRNAAGRRRWLKLGRLEAGYGVQEARKAVTRNRARIQDGDDPLADRQAHKEAAARTLGAFIDGLYTVQAKAELKSADSLLARLKSNFSHWWQEPVSAITKSRVRDWRTKRLAENVKPATVNRDVAALSAVLSAAAAAEPPLISRNPIARELKPLSVDQKGRCRYLAPDEEKRLMDALAARDAKMIAQRKRANAWRKERGYDLLPKLGPYGDHLTPVVVLALNTGMRRGEILGLQWRYVNFENNLITAAGVKDSSGGGGTKSGKTRHIPMTKAALATLKAWREQQGRVWPGGLIFPGPAGQRMLSLKTAFNRILKDAEITDFRFHDCRHHFCSMLVQRGVALAKVKELAGHSTIQLTERYAHLAPDDLAAAIRVLDEPGKVTPIQQGSA